MGYDELGNWDESRPSTVGSAPPVASNRRPTCSPRHRKCSPHHLDLVEGYRLWRLNWEEERERVALGYKEEEKLFSQENPPPTFKAWLKGQRGKR